MELNKYESCESCPICCPKNPNPWDAQLRVISIANRHSPHQSKELDTVFNIQTIGWYIL